MNARDHHYYRGLIGAYVSGKIEGGERRDLLDHLEDCEACRNELSELQDVAALLSERIARDTLEPPPQLEENIVSEALAEQEPRHDNRRGNRSNNRRRVAVAGIAAAVVLVVAVGLATAGLPLPLGGPEEPGLGDVEPISFTGAPEEVAVDGAVVAHTWGTEIVLEVEGLRDGEVYTVTIEGESGDEVPAGTFVGDSDVPVECELNGAVLRENAQEVLVRNSEQELVLRSELEA